MLLQLSPIIHSPLKLIINQSLITGIFPDQFKIAIITPIYKGKQSDPHWFSNYRPISLLNSFSKIYEKLMHNRLMEFFESNNSLYENQYGFRPKRSCEHALLNAQNILLESLSKRQVSLLLLIDFSKAFDMVEHKILLEKLTICIIYENFGRWPQRYYNTCYCAPGSAIQIHMLRSNS